MPQLDAACSSLVTDLAERGMLERTIVAVFGDFGRTPQINANNGGRDHWNFCYSLMLIGGGFKQGLISRLQRWHRRLSRQQSARPRRHPVDDVRGPGDSP